MFIIRVPAIIYVDRRNLYGGQAPQIRHSKSAASQRIEMCCSTNHALASDEPSARQDFLFSTALPVMAMRALGLRLLQRANRATLAVDSMAAKCAQEHHHRTLRHA